MLLRRFIEHVTGQNWVAVGLDFMIVVLGVCIGIQVSNLNDVRKDGALARDYLERLTADAAREITDCDHMLERIAAKRAGLERLAAALESQDRSDLSDAFDDYGPNFFIDARRSTNFGRLTEIVHSPTYDEMIGSGRLTLIRQAAMRKFIVGYYARRQVQTSRTAGRLSDFGNLMYRHAPPQPMAVDQLASDDEIPAAMSSFDTRSLLARFHDAGLLPHVNAELSFAHVMQREVREDRVAAEEFRSVLRTYLDTGEVTVSEWDPVG